MAPTQQNPIFDPQQLEPLLIARAQAGDVDGMAALFEPDAVLAIGGGTISRAALRRYAGSTPTCWPADSYSTQASSTRQSSTAISR